MSKSRAVIWASRVAQFVVGQGALQATNVLLGFLLLRWLSVEAYAQYSVAFAFYSVLTMMVDLGVLNSIVALAGERARDRGVLGRYVRAAMHLRSRMIVAVAGVGLATFLLLTAKQHWGLRTNLLLFSAVLATVYFQGGSAYSVALRVHNRITAYYAPQVCVGVTRLCACFALYWMGMLTSWVAALFTAVGVAATAAIWRRLASPYVDEPRHSAPDTNREMIRFVAPLVPSLIYVALQGQITVGVITLFGDTKSVADIAALARLGQVFTVPGAFATIVLEPYFGQLASSRVRVRYLQIAAIATALAGASVAVAAVFPTPFLLLLGTRYQHLRAEVAWMVLSASIGFLGGVFWVLNHSRKWNRLGQSMGYVLSVLATQAGCVLLVDLHTTRGVLYFGIATAAATALTNLLVGLLNLGFDAGPRQTPAPDEVHWAMEAQSGAV